MKSTTVWISLGPLFTEDSGSVFFSDNVFLFFSVWGPGVSHLAYYQNRKKQRNPEAPGRLEKMQFAPEPYLCFFNPVLLFLLESVRTILDNFE